jgi:hypothetical protein
MLADLLTPTLMMAAVMIVSVNTGGFSLDSSSFYAADTVS